MLLLQFLDCHCACHDIYITYGLVYFSGEIGRVIIDGGSESATERAFTIELKLELF